ncbi:energy transducer TonB family protein [Sphingomonas pituitosa]|uniref:energy transducer TonB family protein n=1 Tax=Sphingomonas pituitosa TaxID=99597 RepID=UPI000A00BF5F|nr:energy transducer TonB [Sphingomonas pituitosa]
MVAFERPNPGVSQAGVVAPSPLQIVSARHGYQPHRQRAAAAMLGMTPVAVGVVLAFLPWHGMVTARPVAPPLTVTLLPLPSPSRAEPKPVRHQQATSAPAKPVVAQPMQRQARQLAPSPAPAPVVPVIPTIAVGTPTPVPPAAPVANPAPEAAPTSPPAQSAGKDSWEARVVARLESLKRFPPAARSRRDQGVATVRFRVNRQGALLASSLVGTSGSRLLDQGALATVARAQPYPPIPVGRGDEIELVVPIEFLLGRR